MIRSCLEREVVLMPYSLPSDKSLGINYINVSDKTICHSHRLKSIVAKLLKRGLLFLHLSRIFIGLLSRSITDKDASFSFGDNTVGDAVNSSSVRFNSPNSAIVYPVDTYYFHIQYVFPEKLYRIHAMN